MFPMGELAVLLLAVVCVDLFCCMLGRILNPLVLFPGEKVAFWRKYIAFRSSDIWITLSWCLLTSVGIFLIYGQIIFLLTFRVQWTTAQKLLALSKTYWETFITVVWKNSMQFRKIFLNSLNHVSCIVSDKVGDVCLVKETFLCALKFLHNTMMVLSKIMIEF